MELQLGKEVFSKRGKWFGKRTPMFLRLHAGQDVEAGFATRTFQPRTSGQDRQDWEFEIVSFQLLCNVDGDVHD